MRAMETTETQMPVFMKAQYFRLLQVEHVQEISESRALVCTAAREPKRS